MVRWTESTLKSIEKNKIPEKTFHQIAKCFEAIDKVGDIAIFDTKRIKGNYEKEYYRLRKGNYRAIFHFEKKDIVIIDIRHRKEIYRKWE